MFFNQNGGKLDNSDYAGIYILTEKIKSGKDRLDIAGIEPGDNTGTALTGGYIFKIDRADGNEYSWVIPGNTVPGSPSLPSAAPKAPKVRLDRIVMVENPNVDHFA